MQINLCILYYGLGTCFKFGKTLGSSLHVAKIYNINLGAQVIAFMINIFIEQIVSKLLFQLWFRLQALETLKSRAKEQEKPSKKFAYESDEEVVEKKPKKSKKKRDKSPDALELLEDILETRKKKSKKSKSSDEEGGRKRRKKKHRHKHSSNSDSDSNNSNSDLKKAWEEIKMKWEKKLKKKVVSESE